MRRVKKLAEKYAEAIDKQLRIEQEINYEGSGVPTEISDQDITNAYVAGYNAGINDAAISADLHRLLIDDRARLGAFVYDVNLAHEIRTLLDQEAEG